MTPRLPAETLASGEIVGADTDDLAGPLGPPDRIDLIEGIDRLLGFGWLL